MDGTKSPHVLAGSSPTTEDTAGVPAAGAVTLGLDNARDSSERPSQEQATGQASRATPEQGDDGSSRQKSQGSGGSPAQPSAHPSVGVVAPSTGAYLLSYPNIGVGESVSGRFREIDFFCAVPPG